MLAVSLFGIEDPVFLLIAGFLVTVFFALFLVLRRTITGFKEGMQQGRDR
jgi:hypothetical protein